MCVKVIYAGGAKFFENEEEEDVEGEGLYGFWLIRFFFF